MRMKQFSILLITFLCCSLLAVAQAPVDRDPFIGGGGTKGDIPLFTAHRAIGNSIASQSGSAINVNGGVNTVLGGASSVNSVFGSNTSGPGTAAGAGVYGQISTTGQSGTGSLFAFGGGGTWGDGGLDANYAVIGTTDNKAAGIFQANGTSYYTLFSFNYNTAAFPFAAINGAGLGCNIDPSGNLTCTGAKNAVVPVDGGKHKVALAAIESPKNWFEDFGSAQLRGGVAVIRLDSRFTQTINTAREYHVFLTPNGDCKGLYVHQKSGNSFEVRELGGGNSNVRFDYRITALRKNYENVRFADHTREFSHVDSSARVFAQK
jgi:hypothetical protein